jgi:hypothetical protein
MKDLPGTIHKFTNAEFEITTFVVNPVTEKYSVILRDDESGGLVQTIKIFNNEDAAVKYAKLLVGSK